jgi:hypothetical protein
MGWVVGVLIGSLSGMLLRDMGVGEALLHSAVFISIAMLPLLPPPFIARHVERSRRTDQSRQ